MHIPAREKEEIRKIIRNARKTAGNGGSFSTEKKETMKRRKKD